MPMKIKRVSQMQASDGVSFLCLLLEKKYNKTVIQKWIEARKPFFPKWVHYLNNMSKIDEIEPIRNIVLNIKIYFEKNHWFVNAYRDFNQLETLLKRFISSFSVNLPFLIAFQLWIFNLYCILPPLSFSSLGFFRLDFDGGAGFSSFSFSTSSKG